MHRHILVACLPYLALIIVCFAVLRVLLWFGRARPDLRQIAKLHGDQAGAVQSLSFVLTLPLFVIVLMFIVQLSQLTIAKVVVEYAAYSATRAALVWLPANLGDGAEIENQFQGGWQRTGTYRDANGGPLFSEYQIVPGGAKFRKIQLAAAMGCMSISPSCNVGMPQATPPMPGLASLQQVYAAMAPASTANPQIGQRLSHKLAYALNNTRLSVRVRHREDEPPLQLYPHLCRDVWPYFPGDQFQSGEFGWQDQIVVTVQHDFALLPGPGRILARRANAPIGTDPDANRSADYQNGVIQRRLPALFVYPLTATVRLNNEGERSRMSYVQPVNGMAPVLPAGMFSLNAAPSSGANSGANSASNAALVYEDADFLSGLFAEQPWFKSAPCLDCREEGAKVP